MDDKLKSFAWEVSHFVHDKDGSQFYWSLNDGKTGGYANTLEEALNCIVAAKE